MSEKAFRVVAMSVGVFIGILGIAVAIISGLLLPVVYLSLMFGGVAVIITGETTYPHYLKWRRERQEQRKQEETERLRKEEEERRVAEEQARTAEQKRLDEMDLRAASNGELVFAASRIGSKKVRKILGMIAEMETITEGMKEELVCYMNMMGGIDCWIESYDQSLGEMFSYLQPVLMAHRMTHNLDDDAFTSAVDNCFHECRLRLDLAVKNREIILDEVNERVHKRAVGVNSMEILATVLKNSSQFGQKLEGDE